MTMSPVSGVFSACARSFRSEAALATSPCSANATSFLIFTSRREACLNFPPSRKGIGACNARSSSSQIGRAALGSAARIRADALLEL